MKKKSSKSWLRRTTSLGLVIVIILQFVVLAKTSGTVQASVEPNGPLKRVIVTYRGEAATADSPREVADQVSELRQREAWLTGAMQYAEGYKKVIMSYSQLPIVTMDVDAEGEASLRNNPNVLSVQDDEILQTNAVAYQYTPDVLGGSPATGFSDGVDDFTGAGTAVVVLDTGVQSDHEALDGQVVSEACYGINQTYSNAIVESACPGGATSSTATGSGAPCPTDCDHGTEVASTIAMLAATITDGSDNFDTSGVAKDAKIVAIQINMKVTEIDGQADICGDLGDTEEVCYRPSMALAVAGMNRALELQNNNTLGIPIVAVNNSNGSTTGYADTSTCAAADADGVNTAAAALKAKNIAPIVAAGNSGESASHYDKVTYPACLSNTIAVSASSATDTMSYYSNAGSLTDLLAPGGNVSGEADDDGGLFVAKTGGLYNVVQGTSFASPITSAAFAVIRERNPDASVDGILEGLQDTGVDVTESRTGYTTLTHKRIDIAAALEVADTFATFTEQQEETPTPSNPGTETPTEWIPGVPNAGSAERTRAVIVIMASAMVLLLINFGSRARKVRNAR